MKRLIIINLVLLFLIQNITAQSIYPIFRRGKKTIFVDNTGKVKFVLPELHAPQFAVPPFRHGFKYKLDIFHSGIATIKTLMNNIYWIDEEGKKIKDFGTKYSEIIPASSNLFLAWEPIKGSLRSSMLIYLDKNGNNVFKDRKFWEASEFSEGLAAVMNRKNENWYFININADTVLMPTIYPKEKIKRLYNFHGGLAKIALYDNKKSYRADNYVFIDKQGKEIINVKNLYPDKSIYDVSDYNNKLIEIIFNSDRRKKDVVFINKNGKEIINIKNIFTADSFHNSVALIKTIAENKDDNSEIVSYLIDEKGNKVEIKLENGFKLNSIISNKKLLNILVKDNNGKITNCLYNLKTSKNEFCTEANIITYNENVVLTGTNNKSNYVLYDYTGKILWQPKIEEKVFKSLKEALKVKDQVRKYEVLDASDFSNGLFKLKNLEELKFNSLEIKNIPHKISLFKKLKKLSIVNLPQIKSIPKEIWDLENLEKLVLVNLENVDNISKNKNLNSKIIAIEIIELPHLSSLEIGNLKNLEYFDIFDCKNLKTGVEEIIEQSPKLKLVRLSGVKVKKDFIDKMKKKKPNLSIDYLFSF